MALDLSVETTVHGVSDAWTVSDLSFGPQEPVVLQGEKRLDYRVEMTVSEHDKGVLYDVVIVEVKRGLLGRTTETVVSQPRLLTEVGKPALMVWGHRADDGEMVDDVRLEVLAE